MKLPWMEDDDDEFKKKRNPPRIIRQPAGADSGGAKPKETDDFEFDAETEQADQVIVIGLDETGQQPSEEQLTAIIQV